MEEEGRIPIFEKLRAQAKSSRFQTPSSKEAPGPQTPSSKLQRSSNLQARSAGRGLELGTWDFFGVWSLVFGVSILDLLWSLGFGAWCFAHRRLKTEMRSRTLVLPVVFRQEWFMRSLINVAIHPS